MDFAGLRAGRFEPNADVFVDEVGGQVVVNVEVAGADPDTLRVEVHERALVISGRRQNVGRVRHGSFVQKEIAYGEFAKRISLPVAVEYEAIVAEYRDGLLIIALPIAVTDFIPTARTEIRMIVKRTLV
jgi:HSP20 family protein